MQFKTDKNNTVSRETEDIFSEILIEPQLCAHCGTIKTDVEFTITAFGNKFCSIKCLKNHPITISYDYCKVAKK